MDTYQAETIVKVVIPFKDALGEQVTPTALQYRVIDEAYDEILALTSIPSFDANAGEIELSIGVALNTLAADATAGYRRVELRISVDAVTHVQYAEYILKAGAGLILCKNSFQTYEQAVLRTLSMGDLKGWEGATKEARVSALARAYDSISCFTYRMTKTNDEVIVGDPRQLTSTDFLSLVPLQQEDFCRAQICQADFLLGGSPIEKDIGDGLQSSTIGEVSQFYRPRPSLVTALSRMALYYIGRYIHWNVGIGRA